jgi:hypothetical protein
MPMRISSATAAAIVSAASCADIGASMVVAAAAAAAAAAVPAAAFSGLAVLAYREVADEDADDDERGNAVSASFSAARAAARGQLLVAGLNPKLRAACHVLSIESTLMAPTSWWVHFIRVWVKAPAWQANTVRLFVFCFLLPTF